MKAEFSKKEQQDVWNAIAQGWTGWRNKVRKDVIQFSKNWKPVKILDIGCGNGRNLYYFAINGFDFYGIDFSKNMVKEAKRCFRKNKLEIRDRHKKERFIIADMTELPFRDETFDYCISIASLHHLPKDQHEKALSEIKRVLKKNGECIISVWNKYSFSRLDFWFLPKETYVVWKRNKEGKHKQYNRYYYLFSYSEFKKFIQKIGFKIKKASGRFEQNITFLIVKD